MERTRWRAGVSVLPVPRSPAAGAPQGLLLAPILQGGAGIDIPLGAAVTLKIEGAFGVADAVKLRVLPDGVTAQADAAMVEIAGKLGLLGAPAEPFLLFGARDGTRSNSTASRWKSASPAASPTRRRSSAPTPTRAAAS